MMRKEVDPDLVKVPLTPPREYSPAQTVAQPGGGGRRPARAVWYQCHARSLLLRLADNALTGPVN